MKNNTNLDSSNNFGKVVTVVPVRIEFDLDGALDGDAVITRSGLDVIGFRPHPRLKYVYKGDCDKGSLAFKGDGKLYNCDNNDMLDLFMKYESQHIDPIDWSKAPADYDYYLEHKEQPLFGFCCQLINESYCFENGLQVEDLAFWTVTKRPAGYPLADGSCSSLYVVGDKFKAKGQTCKFETFGSTGRCAITRCKSNPHKYTFQWLTLTPTKGTLRKVAKRKEALLPKPEPLVGHVNYYADGSFGFIWDTSEEARQHRGGKDILACIDLSQHRKGEGL